MIMIIMLMGRIWWQEWGNISSSLSHCDTNCGSPLPSSSPNVRIDWSWICGKFTTKMAPSSQLCLFGGKKFQSILRKIHPIFWFLLSEWIEAKSDDILIDHGTKFPAEFDPNTSDASCTSWSSVFTSGAAPIFCFAKLCKTFFALHWKRTTEFTN